MTNAKKESAADHLSRTTRDMKIVEQAAQRAGEESLTKTIEQLQAAAAEAAATLAVAQAAAAEAEARIKEKEAIISERERREALRNATEPARYVAERKHLSAIAAAMLVDAAEHESLKAVLLCSVTESRKTVTEDEEEEGPTVRWAVPRLVVQLRGEPVYNNLIEFRAEASARSSRSWRCSSYTGRVRCSVGGFGDRQSFPPRKDGTFNYAAIATKLMSDVHAAERKYQDALKVCSNADALAKLTKQFALPKYSHTLEAVRSHGGSSHPQPFHQTAAPAGRLYLKLDALVTPEQAETILNAAIGAGVKLS